MSVLDLISQTFEVSVALTGTCSQNADFLVAPSFDLTSSLMTLTHDGELKYDQKCIKDENEKPKPEAKYVKLSSRKNWQKQVKGF